jgi:predicted nuclease of predicted toxin-antitoxin system
LPDVAGFLIDANLPYRLSLWRGSEYRHVFDLGDTWSDLQIWEYAKREDLTIVSKDTDFSALAMLNEPPPRVIHLRIGNMRMRDLQALLRRIWPEVYALSPSHRLLLVFPDRIEGVR